MASHNEENSSLTQNIDSNDDDSPPTTSTHPPEPLTLPPSNSQRGDPLSNYPQQHPYYASSAGHSGSQQNLAANPFYDGASNPSYASGFNGGNVGMMQSDSTHYNQGYELEDEAKVPLTEKYGYGNGASSQYK